MNPLIELLGIEIPILQAPTGSVAGPELCAAVSEAGALGAMGITWADPRTAAEHVRAVRAATDRPFAVNFALSFEPRGLDAALEGGVPVVTFSWGEPGPLVARCKAAGAKVGIQVGSAAGAALAREQGAEFLICQGIEAGGHVQSTLPLEKLLPLVLAAAGGLPVVATGGIASGGRIARVLELGAQGVMLGTRFVATRESRAHPEYKRALIEAKGDATLLTVCFDGGWAHAPHRVLRNSTAEAWEAAGCPPPGRRPGEAEEVATTASGEQILRYEDTAPRAGMEGDVRAMAMYAGEGIGRIHDIPAAGDLVRRLWSYAQYYQSKRR